MKYSTKVTLCVYSVLTLLSSHGPTRIPSGSVPRGYPCPIVGDIPTDRHETAIFGGFFVLPVGASFVPTTGEHAGACVPDISFGL